MFCTHFFPASVVRLCFGEGHVNPSRCRITYSGALSIVSFPQTEKAKMGEIRMTRDFFLWCMSVIYLFAFSSLFVQIPGRSGESLIFLSGDLCISSAVLCIPLGFISLPPGSSSLQPTPICFI